MDSYSLRTLFDVTNNQKEITIKGFEPYRIETTFLREQGRQNPIPLITYGTPIIKLENVTVLGGGRYPFDESRNLWTGGLYYHQDRIESNSEADAKQLCDEAVFDLVNSSKTKEKVYIDRGILIGSRPNFGHFLFEFLPKIYLANKYYPQGYNFLLPDNTPPRFLNYLSLLSIDESRISLYSTNQVIQAEELVIPGVAAHRHPLNKSPCVDRTLLSSMVSQIKTNTSIINGNVDSNEKDLTIYISRKDERWRRIINEQQIINHIQRSRRLKVLNPSLLSPIQQLSLFDRLTLLYSPLGGASASVMFCKPRAEVVEFSTPKISGDFGHKIWSIIFDLKFTRIDGRYTEECKNDGQLVIDRDFFLDIELIPNF